MMTVRKRVGPLPIQQLDVRHSVDHSSSDYFSPDDSPRDSSSDSSSETSSYFHSDASSDSSSRHLLSDHSSSNLPSTSAGPSCKRQDSVKQGRIVKTNDSDDSRVEYDKLQQFYCSRLQLMIFDPNEEDDIWLNNHYWELLRWKLHEYSGVYSLFLDGMSIQINMLLDKKYPLKKEILKKMINLKIEAEEESDMASELIKFIKSQIAEQS
ncbi:hypothetical protein Tco_0795436 [Tanacetum coccineum]